MSTEIQDAVALAQEIQQMTLAEATLESAINVTCVELSLAITQDEQREIFERIQQLHGQRTAAQVARLERQRGLSK